MDHNQLNAMLGCLYHYVFLDKLFDYLNILQAAQAHP